MVEEGAAATLTRQSRTPDLGEAPCSGLTNRHPMMATTATDTSGVEYYFECTAGGGNDSGWQDSTTYIDTGLTPETSYTYRVKARDKSANQNETGWSSEASATTGSTDIYVHDITMGSYRSGANYIAQATVWIKGSGGEPTFQAHWSPATGQVM